MPIMNMTKETMYPFRVYAADKMLARLVGLLGTAEEDPEKALYIVPCSGIHTFGMKYPIDVLFLNAEGRVVWVEHSLQSNRIVKPVIPSKSVLELPAGAAQTCGIRLNDNLQVVPDDASRPDLKRMGGLMHWPLNLFIAFLWGRFVLAALSQWAGESSFLNLGIVVHNTLLMCFFLTRRNSITISSRVMDWVVPSLTLCGAMMLRPFDPEGGTALFSAWLQCAGLAGIIFSLLSLGKSFGIVPANRKIVCAGAYRIVRHPLYLSEMVFYAGFLSGNPSARNVLLVLLILAGQLYRSVSEEHLLALDSSYRSYKQRVRYRFIPGVF
jgi:protein-S-isoprenylcysteine O-methyltransferase Ste14/uncharacterized membrane protein (UPF0127 family)